MTVWALARGGDTGFFRPVDAAVAVRLVPVEEIEGETVGERILRSIALLASAFEGSYDVVHAQDCLTANAVGARGDTPTCGGPCTTSTSSRRPSSPPATSGRWWSRRRWCACRRRWRARSGRAGAGRPQ